MVTTSKRRVLAKEKITSYAELTRIDPLMCTNCGSTAWVHTKHTTQDTTIVFGMDVDAMSPTTIAKETTLRCAYCKRKATKPNSIAIRATEVFKKQENNENTQ